MLGIISRYQKHDSTFAAVAIAQKLQERGEKFSFFVRGWRAKSILPAWDNKVIIDRYDTWIDDKQLIIWTEPADEVWVHYSTAHNIHNYLYSSWEQIQQYDEKSLSYYSNIITPTLMQAMLLRDRFKLENVDVIPYNANLPITHKLGTVEPGKIRLFMSLYGSQLKRVELSAVLMLADICNEFKHVFITIACSKGLAPYTIRDLKSYSKEFTDRWTVHHDCPWHKQVILMGESDLTVWPAKYDGLGLIGLSSLHMGTPVIAWDVPPMNEHLSPGANAILVSCELDHNWLGVPQAVPDYEQFIRSLRWLINRPEVLADLRKQTHDHLESHTKAFNEGWDLFLPT